MNIEQNETFDISIQRNSGSESYRCVSVRVYPRPRLQRQIDNAALSNTLVARPILKLSYAASSNLVPLIISLPS
jgi:hypothetical protein